MHRLRKVNNDAILLYSDVILNPNTNSDDIYHATAQSSQVTSPTVVHKQAHAQKVTAMTTNIRTQSRDLGETETRVGVRSARQRTATHTYNKQLTCTRWLDNGVLVCTLRNPLRDTVKQVPDVTKWATLYFPLHKTNVKARSLDIDQVPFSRVYGPRRSRRS